MSNHTKIPWNNLANYFSSLPGITHCEGSIKRPFKLQTPTKKTSWTVFKVNTQANRIKLGPQDLDWGEMRSVLFLVLGDRCLSDLSKLECTGSDISNFRFVLMSDYWHKWYELKMFKKWNIGVQLTKDKRCIERGMQSIHCCSWNSFGDGTCQSFLCVERGSQTFQWCIKLHLARRV